MAPIPISRESPVIRVVNLRIFNKHATILFLFHPIQTLLNRLSPSRKSTLDSLLVHHAMETTVHSSTLAYVLSTTHFSRISSIDVQYPTASPAAKHAPNAVVSVTFGITMSVFRIFAWNCIKNYRPQRAPRLHCSRSFLHRPSWT